MEPDWHHFRLKWGGAMGCYPLLSFVVSFILRFRGFDPVFAPTWLDFGATGPHLGGLLALIFAFFDAKLAPFWGNWTQERSWMKSNILVWPGGMREAIESASPPLVVRWACWTQYLGDSSPFLLRRRNTRSAHSAGSGTSVAQN